MKPIPTKDIRDSISYEIPADRLHLAIKEKLAGLTSAITTHQTILKEQVKSLEDAIGIMVVLHGGVNLSPEAERIKARLTAINNALAEVEELTLFQRYLMNGTVYILDGQQMRKYGL